MNKTVARVLTRQKRLGRQLVALRLNCKHEYRPVGYRESNCDGGYEVGVFDIFLVCTKCGDTAALKKSPPICSCCGLALELKVWDGRVENGGTPKQLGIWRREHARRAKIYRTLEHGMFFTQIGLYVCVKHGCTREGKSSFYITGGD